MRNYNSQLSFLFHDNTVASAEGHHALYAYPPVIDSRFTPYAYSSESCYDRCTNEITYDIDGNEVRKELTEGDKVIIIDM
jgi:hypothetical protein